MNYPTPMDVAEAEDRAADALDAALDWPYSREVWDRVDAERVELLAANEGLAAELAECTEKRERYALQVCLLLDTMKEAGVHINENWCWCGPTIENHSDDGFTVAVITGPQPYQKPEMMGTITEYPTDSASAVQPERCCLDYPRCDCNSPPEPDGAPDVTCATHGCTYRDGKCIRCWGRDAHSKAIDSLLDDCATVYGGPFPEGTK